MTVPTYKPVHIGLDNFPPEIGNALLRTGYGGVKVLTDSENMQQLLNTCASLSEPKLALNSIAHFTYLTKNSLPFRSTAGTALMQMTKTYPGDIYAAPDMRKLSFYGIDKIGTLLSMCYGIRALHTAQDGQLGLHSALLRDQEDGMGILMIGKNRSGKSSIGFGVEQKSSRHELLSDDWNEVSLSTNEATVVSAIYSADRPSDKYSLAFESFGKRFFTKHRELGSITVKKIVEIHDDVDQDREDFIESSLAHIPLMCQPVPSIRSLTSEAIEKEQIAELASKVDAVKQGYVSLLKYTRSYSIINNSAHNSVEEAVERVLELVT